MKPDPKRLAAFITAGIGLAVALNQPARAQDEPSDAESALLLEEVIVTGTRIESEDGFGRTSPVTVIDMEEIAGTGFTRVEDILGQLPSVRAVHSSFLSGNSSGTASLSTRGGGANRTLVLINGRRMQAGGLWTTAPDVNQIPAAMVERVEVLTGGASATYGADAVVGVINFIMRRVDGVELSTGISGYQHDNDNGYIQGLMDAAGYDYPTGNTGIDGRSYFANLVAGRDFADGRGNATAYINWRENDPLLQAARDYSSCALDLTATQCFSHPSAEIPNFIIYPLTVDGPGPAVIATLQPDSSLAPYDGTNQYNFAPIYHFMRPDERWSLGAFVDFRINEHAVPYLEVMAARDRTDAQVSEAATFFAEPYQLSIDNAYFPDNFRNSLSAAFPGTENFLIFIGKRNVEGGPRRELFEHTGLRVVAGVKGLITGDWNYDISYLHAQTTASDKFENDLLGPSVAVAVDSRLCEADPDCIPYQVFTYEGVTAEAAASLSKTAILRANTSTDVIQAYATGDLGWGLPAGDILAAAGFEYRRVEYKRRPDATLQQGLLLGHGLTPTPGIAGAYSVDELFVEANVPLLADTAFARNLTLDLAYRWSDYSTSGQSSTYRAGFDWHSLDWLRLRAGFNYAERTPDVTELYFPRERGLAGFADPCLGTEPHYTLEQCMRTGMTAGQYGNTPAFGDGALVNTIRGGNPDLEPEEADTITVGLVFDIGDSMRLSVDYWDIDMQGAIFPLPAAQVFDQCALHGRLCERVRRNAQGGLWLGGDGYIDTTLVNYADAYSRGVDIAWDWILNSNWRFDFLGSYYLKVGVNAIPGDSGTENDCTGVITTSCAGSPQWRHIASATYEPNRTWSVNGRWRHNGSVDYPGGPYTLADSELSAFNYFDLNATFRFGDAHRLIIGVSNIFDEEPPLLGAGLSFSANTSPGLWDPLGRYLFANLTFSWSGDPKP